VSSRSGEVCCELLYPVTTLLCTRSNSYDGCAANEVNELLGTVGLYSSSQQASPLRELTCHMQWRIKGVAGGMPPPAGGVAIEVLVHLTSVMSCELVILHIWSQKIATSGNYINTVKTAFKWRTNHRKFFII